MGKSCACKFLYGDSTDAEEKDKIDEALDLKKELKTEILLGRKNGKYFPSCFIRSNRNGHILQWSRDCIASGSVWSENG